MKVRETGTSTAAFGHENHPLLRQRVRDPASLREGVLMAVVREPLNLAGGEQRETRTAYVRADDGIEFTASPMTLELT
ncbi:hypothetical protein ACIOD1_13105 [Streptomyces sp. NPDC088097]|uniref:hypothetical protein n=1 Tax=Streptomyces sp. NPDC088097 TaxID=3365823 RepID=UPI00380EA6B2